MPELVLPSLVHPTLTTTVLGQREVTSEERKVEKAALSDVTERGGSLQMFWGSTMYHLQDLPYNELKQVPDVFTPFRKKMEDRCGVRELLPIPKKGDLPFIGKNFGEEHAEALARLPSLPELSAELPLELQQEARRVLHFQEGERAAPARLKHYVWDTDSIARYFETRNGMLVVDYSTKLSPWLSLGSLSPCQVFWEVKRYQNTRTSNKKHVLGAVRTDVACLLPLFCHEARPEDLLAGRACRGRQLVRRPGGCEALGGWYYWAAAGRRVHA